MTSIKRRTFNTLSMSAILAAALVDKSYSQAAASSKNIPFLRGINFTGLTSTRGSQAPAAGAVDYYILQKKMNVVRLNFDWAFLQPQLFGAFDIKNVAILQQQINRITQAGAYVILELHNFGRLTVNGTEQIIGESPELTADHFADVWTKIALQWRDNAKIIFELMNEPHDQDTATLVTVSNAAIAAIRATGAKNLIMVCGNEWNSMGWLPGSDNQTHMLDIVDPLDNFCFDVHHYFDNWSQGQTPNVRNDPIASMEEFTKWAKNHGKLGFCGEFGCSTNKRGLEACAALLDHIEQNPDVYLGWAWWGAGGPWQPDYVFLLDPFASISSRVNPDPKGSATWANPIDRPQMKVLQKFLPKTATPFNAWLIEDALLEQVEVMYRHGDFRGRSKSSGFFDDAKEDNIWLDSGPARRNAHDPSATIVADKQGGVTFFEPGQFLTADASINQRNIYAVVAADPARTGPSSVILAGDSRTGKMQSSLSASVPKAPLGAAKAEGGNAADGQGNQKYLLGVRSAKNARESTIFSFQGEGGRWQQGQDDGDEAGKLIIGAANEQGEGIFGGAIYDIVVLSNEISDDDHLRIQGRLYWDMGLAHQLPSDHRYRTRPPEI